MIREEGQTLSVFIVDDESTARNLFKRIHKIDKDNKNFGMVENRGQAPLQLNEQKEQFLTGQSIRQNKGRIGQ